jgi:membrane protein
VNVKVIWKILSATYTKWTADHAQRLGAALAFYTVFSLAPLLLIVIAIAGLVFGQEAAEGHIIGQIQGLVGEESAKAIQGILEQARQPTTGLIATGLALATLLFGATGVFAQLQEALNTIWGVETKPGLGIIQTLKDRFISFVAALGSGFLLLVSLVLSAGLAAVGHTLDALLPASEAMLQAINFLLSFVVITLLFAMIYKMLPDVSIHWSDVWVGAGMTSLLFTIGKFLIGVYLGKSDVGLAYGAAGSLIVILLWVYYASQIFLFGAEFTAVYAASHGSRLIPVEHAMPAHEGAVAVPGVASLSPRRSREAKEPRIGEARIFPHIEVARMTVRDALIIGGGLAAVLYLGRRPRDY